MKHEIKFSWTEWDRLDPNANYYGVWQVNDDVLSAQSTSLTPGNPKDWTSIKSHSPRRCYQIRLRARLDEGPSDPSRSTGFVVGDHSKSSVTLELNNWTEIEYTVVGQKVSMRVGEVSYREEVLSMDPSRCKIAIWCGKVTIQGLTILDLAQPANLDQQELTTSVEMPPNAYWQAADEHFLSDGNQIAIFQKDGNFVLYGEKLPNTKDRPVLWASDTAGRGEMLVMMPEGDLSLRNKDGQGIWHSNTSGHPGATLRLEEGRLAVVSKGRTVWASRRTAKEQAEDHRQLMASKVRLFQGHLGPRMPPEKVFPEVLRYALTSGRRPQASYLRANGRFMEEIVKPHVKGDAAEVKRAAQAFDVATLDILDELATNTDWGKMACGKDSTNALMLLRVYELRGSELR